MKFTNEEITNLIKNGVRVILTEYFDGTQSIYIRDKDFKLGAFDYEFVLDNDTLKIMNWQGDIGRLY